MVRFLCPSRTGSKVVTRLTQIPEGVVVPLITTHSQMEVSTRLGDENVIWNLNTYLDSRARQVRPALEANVAALSHFHHFDCLQLQLVRIRLRLLMVVVVVVVVVELSSGKWDCFTRFAIRRLPVGQFASWPVAR